MHAVSAKRETPTGCSPPAVGVEGLPTLRAFQQAQMPERYDDRRENLEKPQCTGLLDADRKEKGGDDAFHFQAPDEDGGAGLKPCAS